MQTVPLPPQLLHMPDPLLGRAGEPVRAIAPVVVGLGVGGDSDDAVERHGRQL
jgi:hypothetical protein